MSLRSSLQPAPPSKILFMMKNWLFIGLISWFFYPSGLYAQVLASVRLTSDRSPAPGLYLHRLPAAPTGTFFYSNSGKPFVGTHFLAANSALLPYSSSAEMGNLLPKWTPESLPFFCRVEHDCGKKLPFAFKFRLGSVEYVDRLEGKSIWLGQ